MKARARFGKGVEILGRNIDQLYREFPEICKKAVYDGAGVVGDKFRANNEGVPVDAYSGTKNKDPYFWANHKKAHGLTQSQKDGLLAHAGISEYREGIETIDKKIGVEDYNNTRTRNYPKGQPNALVLRSLEKGTDYHEKFTVVRNTANQTRAKARKEMEKTITQEVKKRLG